jgi:hypothetical protein
MYRPPPCLAIRGALLIAMLAMLGPAGGLTASSQGASVEAELIERMLNPPQPTIPQAGVAPRESHRVLLPGALPAGLPDVPLPPGRLIGSVARITDGELTEVQVLVDVPGPPDEVHLAYADAAARRGWSPGSSGPAAPQSGFRSASRAQGRLSSPSGFSSPGGLYCREDSPASLRVSADERLPGQTELTVDVSLTGAALCGPSPAPASMSVVPNSPGPIPPGAGLSVPPLSLPGLGPGFRGAPAPPSDLIPTLLPPDGVPDPAEVLRPSTMPGSGGGPASSQATLSTELSASELEAHYARQLEAAGWVRLAGGGDRLAWSRWQASADGAWEGLLLAFEEPGRPQRLVRLAVAATSRDPERVEPRPLRSMSLTSLANRDPAADRRQQVDATQRLPMALRPGAPRLAQQEVSPLEAAERLLSRPARDLVGRRLWLRLLPGALPDELAAFPLPSGSDLVGTSLHMGDSHVLSADVMLDAAQAPDAVLAFFAAELTRLGWAPAPNAMTAGFSNLFPGGMEMGEYCQSESGPYLRLSLYPREAGGSHVQAQAEIGETDRCLRQTRTSRPLSSELVPSLTGPNRESVSFSGRGQSRTETAVEAAVATEASLDRLDAHFAEQLAAGGWTRLMGDGDGSLVWSLWSLPDYGDWEALVVLTPGPGGGGRTLFIRLKSLQDA